MPSSIDSASSLRRRGEPEGDVLQHLDQHAAEAEGDQLAEARIGDGADDDLLPAGRASAAPARRRSWRRPCSAWRWRGWCRSPCDTSSALFRPTSTPPASVLCRMSGETIFSTTGKPMPLGELRGLVGRVGHAFLRHRDAVGVADQLALRRRQRRAPVGLDLVEHLADGFLVAHLLHRRLPLPTAFSPLDCRCRLELLAPS